MTWLRALFGGEPQRREDAPAPPAPPPAPEPAPVPVALTVGGDAERRPPYPTPEHVELALAELDCVAKVAPLPVWAVLISAACRRHAIDTPARLAAFLANVAHETGKLSKLVESLNYRADKLVRVFGAHRITQAQADRHGRLEDGRGRVLRAADQKAIALIVYGGAMGKKLGNRPGTDDPWIFRGHGGMQNTGRYNFQRFGAMIGKTAEELPAILASPEGAIESAAHFWDVAGCNVEADAGDIDRARMIVNGGTNGLAEVREMFSGALGALSGGGSASV